MDRFTAIGVVMAAYGINVVLLEIQSTLATPPKTIVSMRKGLSIGFGAVFIMYMAVTVVGYLAYGDCASDNILTQVA